MSGTLIPIMLSANKLAAGLPVIQSHQFKVCVCVGGGGGGGGGAQETGLEARTDTHTLSAQINTCITQTHERTHVNACITGLHTHMISSRVVWRPLLMQQQLNSTVLHVVEAPGERGPYPPLCVKGFIYIYILYILLAFI